jgi:hypothetical protein
VLRYYGDKTVEEPGQSPQKSLDVVAKNYERSGTSFIPFITAPNGLVCRLDEGPNEACLIIRVETANVDPFGSPWELHL